MRRSWVWVAVLAGACLGSPPASAQSQSVAADALFKQGVELAKGGDFKAAAAKLQASYQLDPARGTLQALAMAEERAGKLASAHGHFSELLDLSIKEQDRPREKVARERLEKLAPRLPRLELFGTLPPDAELMLDQLRLPAAALGTALPVDPGAHVIKATAAQGSFQQTVTIEEAQLLRVEVVLTTPSAAASTATPASAAHAPVAPEPASSSSALSTAGWVASGVGVVGLGLGTWFWLKSNATYDEVQRACPNDRCTTDISGKVSDGKSQETLARVGMIVGGVALAGGVTMLVIGRKPGDRGASSAQLRIGPSWAALEGRF
jgi:hypothetical protein